KVMRLCGSSWELEDVAVSVRLAAGGGRAPTVNATGAGGSPPRAVTFEMVGRDGGGGSSPPPRESGAEGRGAPPPPREMVGGSVAVSFPRRFQASRPPCPPPGGWAPHPRNSSLPDPPSALALA